MTLDEIIERCKSNDPMPHSLLLDMVIVLTEHIQILEEAHPKIKAVAKAAFDASHPQGYGR